MKKLNFGFTLIELLIVIAILAILAIGLMAALDPMEQLKKARDTSTRNSVEEFYNAALRYNAVKAFYPWESVEQTTVALSEMTTTYIQSLINMGELKEAFKSDTIKLGKVLVTSTHPETTSTNMDDLAVCYQPESKSLRSDQDAKYDADGNESAGECFTTTSECYWCIK